jgi:hypothetical protein
MLRIVPGTLDIHYHQVRELLAENIAWDSACIR